MLNFIRDENPFNLAGPPAWFLQRLREFDDSLVIVPSRQGFMYRLAQRRPIKPTEHKVQQAMWHYTDTRMLARYGLVPVTTILATANWSNPYLFVALANRAPWRLGGANKVVASLEQQEQAARDAIQAKTDEHLTGLGKDGWQLYRNKIGLGRTIFTNPHSGAPNSGQTLQAPKRIHGVP